MRSGLHFQKQVVTSPIVHFGLGEATGAEVVRITWPNGALQAEFDTKADTVVKATQRLKGSCPWLFAWNGREMAFVTDLLWRSPLGLRINAQATADVADDRGLGEGRGPISSRRATASTTFASRRNCGRRISSISSRCWSSITRRAPRCSSTSASQSRRPTLKVVATDPVQPFASVHDDRGADVSELAGDTGLPLRRFRGPRRVPGHHAPAFRGDGAAGRPRRDPGPLWLVAQGWMHPTDSSINVAIAQGAHDRARGPVAAGGRRERALPRSPHGPRISVGQGQDDPHRSDGPLRRARCHGACGWRPTWRSSGTGSDGRSAGRTSTSRRGGSSLIGADLAYRGYSVTEQPSASVPERPRYTLAGTGAALARSRGLLHARSATSARCSRRSTTVTSS